MKNIKFLLCILCFLSLLPFTAKCQDDCSVNGLKVDVKTSPSKSYVTYDTRTICQLPEFYENSPQITTNIYGSRSDKKTTATGFYYVKLIDGRWWVVDPLGYLNICRAVNAVAQGGGASSKSTFTTKYGTSNSWVDKTKDFLNDNGFYCAGAWSTTADIKNNPTQSTRPLAYTLILNWMSGYGSGRTSIEPGHTGYPYNCIFVFEKGFVTYCESKAQSLTSNKSDTNIFGYFSDNELPFYLKSLNNFLKIGKVAPTDENYLATKKWLSDNSFSEADTLNADVQAKFLAFVGQTYYSVVYNAIKKYDPNHMFLGTRVDKGDARDNKYFMQAVGPYVDILSVNYYGVWTPNMNSMKNWGDNLGKPFMVTEFYTKGEDSGLANTSGAGWIVKTQLERGYAYQNYVLSLLESKCCVGWHWFKYMDNDPTILDAEPSNINGNKGLVTIQYDPYVPMMNKMKELNLKVYNLIDYFDKKKAITTLYPEADAYFKGAENHGADDRLGVKYTTDVTTFRESFLRFDLTGLDKNVGSANLNLSVLRAGDANITYKADFVTDDVWTESSITYAQHPAGTYEIGRWKHGSDVSLDVKKPFLETIDSDKKLSIKLSAVDVVVSQLEYASRENTDITLRPRIEFTEDGPVDSDNLTDLFINNYRVPAFNPDTLVYTLVLSQNTTTNPTILYSAANASMAVVLTNPVNVLSASQTDRIATIRTTSADGLKHRTYTLIFKTGNDVLSVADTYVSPEFTFSPNPVDGNNPIMMKIAREVVGKSVLTITDVSGKMVCRTNVSGSDSSIDLNGISRGMYLVSLRNSNGISSQKLIVK